MKRSTFLSLSALGAAGFSIPFIQGCMGRPLNPALGQPVFLSHIFDAKIMQETGQEYIQLAPAEGSESKLAALLAAGGTITEATPAAAVHSYYDSKTKEDFKTGNTIVVNGWILAVTEARQCALFSLNRP